MRYILLFLLFITSLFALPTLDLHNQEESYFDYQTEFYEDKSATQSLKNIQHQTFIKQNNRMSQGYSQSAFWYRFQFKNSTNHELTYFITFTETFQHSVDAFIQKGNVYENIKKGPAYFKKEETNYSEKPIFKVNLKAHEHKEIYLRITSNFPNFTAFNLLNEKDLNNYLKYHDLIYTFFLGALVSLILYNLAIFLFSLDRAYLHYVLYVSFFVWWQLHITSIYPLNSYNSTENYYFVGATIPLMLAFLFFFSCSILRLKLFSPTWATVVRTIGYIYLLLALISLFYINLAVTIMNAMAIFTLPLLLYIGVKNHFQGNKVARFYIIAQLLFLVSSTIFSIAAFGWIEYNTWTRHCIIIGSFFEMILFALALAYRIRMLDKEKHQIIQKSNEELDFKVQERTKELEASKEKLKELASKDSMTNLYNRRSLFELSSKMIPLAKREKSPLCVLIFDIDNFKNINDTYGHKIGDNVIKAFAKLLSNTRESDIVSRIGGEEFVILLPQTTIDGAMSIANKILHSAQHCDIELANGRTLNFTISGGVEILKEFDQCIDDVINRADEALYEAKRSGKNRVCSI